MLLKSQELDVLSKPLLFKWTANYIFCVLIETVLLSSHKIYFG